MKESKFDLFLRYLGYAIAGCIGASIARDRKK